MSRKKRSQLVLTSVENSLQKASKPFPERTIFSCTVVSEVALIDASRNFAKTARAGGENLRAWLHSPRSCMISKAYFSVMYSSEPGATRPKTSSNGDFTG